MYLSKEPPKKSNEFMLFAQQIIRNPIELGAIVPSSKALAKRMAETISDDTGHVIELGAGTGKITHEILCTGLKPSNLTVVEVNQEFCKRLETKFPDIKIINCPAQELNKIKQENVGMIISGLPLLPMKEEIQHQILKGAFELMRKNGKFIQFTYGPKVPITKNVLKDLGLTHKKMGKVWNNFPPAQVYSFSKKDTD